MSSMTADRLVDLPLAPETQKYLESTFIGHLIDGEVVPLGRWQRCSWDRSLRAGTVWINTYQEVNAAVPYGGVNQSGHGRTLGEESLGELLQTKSIWMKVSR